MVYAPPHRSVDDEGGRPAGAASACRLPFLFLEAHNGFKEEVKMEAEFHIEGMHCDSCAVDIKETLEETAGVFKADVTFKRKTAIVDFDEAIVQQATLVKKIQDLGYTAT